MRRVDCPVRAASSLTSPATTEKPRPCSPALAASMVAFSARSRVWLETAWISSRIEPIPWAWVASSAMVREAFSTSSRADLDNATSRRQAAAIPRRSRLMPSAWEESRPTAPETSWRAPETEARSLLEVRTTEWALSEDSPSSSQAIASDWDASCSAPLERAMGSMQSRTGANRARRRRSGSTDSVPCPELRDGSFGEARSRNEAAAQVAAIARRSPIAQSHHPPEATEGARTQETSTAATDHPDPVPRRRRSLIRAFIRRRIGWGAGS
jgi:hypothetical protein